MYAHVKAARIRRKILAVVYKGSSCLICGYDGYEGAMAFHHIHPEEKEFGISAKLYYSWTRLKPELDKCVLLCCRCHAEVHGGLHSLEDYLDQNPSPEEGDRFIETAGLATGKPERRPQAYCQDCEVPISQGAVRCTRCQGQRSLKINWPPLETLILRLQHSSFVRTSRELGVSDNAVRNHLRKHGINPKTLLPFEETE